jgi:2'-5' RNA ligase
LWIGLDIDPVIRKMKAELDRELKYLGFRIDKRDFRPHLTLARIKWMHNKEAMKDLLHAYKDYYFQESTIRKLVYYESVLGREGPKYKVIKSVGFKYASP